MTTPLLTKSSGEKMGKSASGAVWLNEDRLSPYDYYQFWRNTEDADVGKFLAIFTELPMDEVRRLGSLQGAEINEAKKILAFEATQLCHGTEAANHAAETAKQTFEQGMSAAGLPTIEIPQSEFNKPMSVIDLLIRAGLVESKGEAKRLIQGGGVRLNDQAVIYDNDLMQTVGASEFNDNIIKLSAGKKRHVLIRLV